MFFFFFKLKVVKNAKTFRFYSCSLLLMYDGNVPESWLEARSRSSSLPVHGLANLKRNAKSSPILKEQAPNFQDLSSTFQNFSLTPVVSSEELHKLQSKVIFFFFFVSDFNFNFDFDFQTFFGFEIWTRGQIFNSNSNFSKKF